VNLSEVSILIESLKDNEEAQMIVSYVVYNAQWTPKYDIKVFDKDKSMIVTYLLINKNIYYS
jgi:hypothetical protein